MQKYNVMDVGGSLVGEIDAESAGEAVSKMNEQLKAEGKEENANHAEERPEHSGRSAT